MANRIHIENQINDDEKTFIASFFKNDEKFRLVIQKDKDGSVQVFVELTDKYDESEWYRAETISAERSAEFFRRISLINNNTSLDS